MAFANKNKKSVTKYWDNSVFYLIINFSRNMLSLAVDGLFSLLGENEIILGNPQNFI